MGSVYMQAIHGGHMAVARELLDHGANVTVHMMMCPRIQPPMKELLEKHFLEYVFCSITDVVQLFKLFIL